MLLLCLNNSFGKRVVVAHNLLTYNNEVTAIKLFYQFVLVL